MNRAGNGSQHCRYTLMEKVALENELSAEAFDHPDCFCPQHYEDWEQNVATPELESKGFSVGPWVTLDGDSIGPLLRGVQLQKNGETKLYTYG